MLLYRVEDEIVFEASAPMWAEVEKAVENWTSVGDEAIDRELHRFASAIRSHLQHLDADETKRKTLDAELQESLETGVRQQDNLDLI